MKAIFLTDSHFNPKGPASRTDDYEEAALRKLTEVAKAAKQIGADAVFHGGDLFDKPVVSMSLMGRIARIIVESGLDWYVVPGNHDLYGYNVQTLPQTSLGLLAETGVVKILSRKEGAVVFTTDGEEVSFEGQEYHKDIDKRDPSLDYYVTGNAKYKVLIPHSMMLDKEYFPDVHYTKTSDIAGKTDADLILGTHFHDSYPLHMIGKTSFVNIGSMMRDEASKGNVKRTPQYMVLTWEKGKMDIQILPFSVAQPGKDIFDRTQITDKKAKDKYLQAFEKKITEKALSAVDVRSVLNRIQFQDQKPDMRIYNEAGSRLTEAEKLVDDIAKQSSGYKEKPANIYISGIEVKGFQSHADTVMDFDAGLNAIIGSSDSGKSAIIRALRFALYNEPRGSDFVRKGSKSAFVKVKFSDGSALVRERTAKSSGTYTVIQPDGSSIDLQGFTNNVPVDVPNVHQMPYIQLTKDLEVSLNIGYQLDVPFLIGESPSTRAAVIGRLTGVNIVDGAVREIGKDILGNSRDIKTYSEQISDIISKRMDYADLAAMHTEILAGQQKVKEIEAKQGLAEAYDDLQIDLYKLKKEEYEVKVEAAKMAQWVRLAPKVEAAEQQYKKYHQLDQLHKQHQSIQRDVTDLETELHEVRYAEKMVLEVAELQAKYLRLRALEALQKDILKASNNETKVHAELATLPKHTVADIEALQEKQRRLLEMEALDKAMKETRMQSVQLRKDIRSAEIAWQEADKEYTNILAEAGTCPTCGQTIGGHEHVTI